MNIAREVAGNLRQISRLCRKFFFYVENIFDMKLRTLIINFENLDLRLIKQDAGIY